ncbi:regulatory factor X-associated protein [Spea bombifrons]|uniref:regulatory factor X-associated protein n=1 Tax=Spea bombifrons TaxID=233779 RepID=UPI00234A0585|nr:regulatory factor X-associated protein [Spea bombifrons]
MLQPVTTREEDEEEPSPDCGRAESVGPQNEKETGDARREQQQYGQYQAAEADSTVLFYTMVPGEPDDENSDLLDTSDPRDSTASPEELEDEDNSGDNDSMVTKTCTYQGCQETTSQVAKQRKPWMCKKHRNKMYKDKYKNKKKSDQAMTCTNKLEDNAECAISLTKQRAGSVGDRPPRPTLLEQVLNQKRLALLRSPDVVQFLQTQQQLLSRQAFEQRQSFQGSSP